MTGQDNVNAMLVSKILTYFALEIAKPANIDNLKIALTPDAIPSAENPDELQGVTSGSIYNAKVKPIYRPSQT